MGSTMMYALRAIFVIVTMTMVHATRKPVIDWLYQKPLFTFSPILFPEGAHLGVRDHTGYDDDYNRKEEAARSIRNWIGDVFRDALVNEHAPVSKVEFLHGAFFAVAARLDEEVFGSSTTGTEPG